MKFKCILILALFFSVPVFSQNSINFINSLGDKETATFEDAVTFFMYETGKNPGAFNYNLRILTQLKITQKMNYDKNKSLRRGMVALMAARYLKLKDSLFYLISGSERYAYRACVAHKIMPGNNSEWDKLSGEELIEIMGAVSAMKGAAR